VLPALLYQINGLLCCLHALMRAFSAETWIRWPHRALRLVAEWWYQAMGGYCSSGEATLRNEPPLSEEMSRFLLAWGRIRLSRCLPAPRVLQRVFRGRKSTCEFSYCTVAVRSRTTRNRLNPHLHKAPSESHSFEGRPGTSFSSY
jgi:hypothetical protein